MTENNVENRNKNFKENGKFASGNTICRKKRDRTQTDKLLTALRKAGQKKGLKFWNVVAEKAFIDKEIMKLVVSKLVPTLNEITGEGGSPLNIVYKKVIYNESEDESGL